MGFKGMIIMGVIMATMAGGFYFFKKEHESIEDLTKRPTR